MASVSAELVRDTFGVVEREDWETFAARLHEDAWVSGPPDWPESEPFHGRDAILGQFRRLTADWDSHQFADVEIVSDDGEWVVTTFTWIVRGAASGVPVAAPIAAAYRIEEGRFAESHFRRTLDEVLAIAQ